MKKSIFAVAVASVLTLGAAHAETVLYGSIRYDYESKKVENTLKNGSWDGERLSNLEDAGSRIGLKGSEDLGNGNAVIYNLEWGFNGMDSEASGFKNRLAILGLTGNWGTFTAGRQHNPFKVTIVDDAIVDDFNGSNVISSAAQRAMTTTLKGTKIGTTVNSDGKLAIQKADYSRVGKVIAYTTPDWAGFQANVALMMDDTLYKTNDEKNIDLWTINARYAYDLGASGTILAKAGYIQGKLADVNKSKAWGLFLGYDQDAFGVSVDYANGNHKAKLNAENAVEGPKEKSQGWDIGARFSFGPNYYSTIRATYGQNQVKVDGEKDKVKSWAIGFEQKLSSRTRAWVEYGQEETKFAAVNVDKKKDNTISIGMRHDF
ncbi:porin [Ignatzschineria ureiclastica]|uniref:Porin n=1 Tax=Ignatzschineria ureiclastica TaxID=472582 RepID=A0A2U2AEK9_9GAMM|nr:porin [Ignatzschineria ureiclastica]PWD81095.1 porin [Ignatzschineria ureiclastica]GGZ96199.1 membrane protein [Ignatzschineria ureiclastica]